MMNTVVAMFESSADATRAADILMDEGFRRDEIEIRTTGYTNIGAFRAQPALGAVQLQDAALAVGSQYFQATSEVRLGERRMALVSLLKREDDGAVRVLQRNLGQPARQPLPTPRGDR